MRVAVWGTLGIVYLLGLALPAASHTLRVPSEYPTIKAGLDSASYGDTVLVAPGTYVTNDARDTWIRPGPGVVLVGEAGRDETFIEVCNRSYGVELYECEGARVSGFTVRLVVNDSCGPTMGFSYGVDCLECTDVVIENCCFENLSFGVRVEGQSDAWYRPIIRSNIISGGRSGVGCFNVHDPGRPLIEGNIITDCFWGAEVWNSAPDFDDNEITYCHDGLYYLGACGGNCAGNVIAHNEECGAYVNTTPPLASPWFNGGWALEDANDFYDNGTWDIWYAHSGPDALIMATHNYWGRMCPDFTTKIHGRVNYSPWTDSTHATLIEEDDCPNATEPATWSSIKALFR